VNEVDVYLIRNGASVGTCHLEKMCYFNIAMASGAHHQCIQSLGLHFALTNNCLDGSFTASLAGNIQGRSTLQQQQQSSRVSEAMREQNVVVVSVRERERNNREKQS
jgi:hypothetical protein